MTPFLQASEWMERAEQERLAGQIGLAVHDPSREKWCPDCETWKPLGSFYKAGKQGRDTY